ncbi:MAG: hypothetical protein ABI658_29690 [Acidimicrobiales bacterium]
MTEQEARLRELVRTIVDTAPHPPTAFDISRRVASPALAYDESWDVAPVRRRAILVTAAAVVVVVAIVVALIGGRDQSARQIATRPALIADTWRTLPPAPIVERQSYVAAAAGGEVLFWGGLANDDSHRPLDDGAAYDPVKNSWRTLPKSPLAPRSGSLSVWSGAEWYVLGGGDGVNRFVDAAAYNPATNKWRRIADLPFPVTGVMTRAAWTGAGIVLWDGHTATYDPASNEWRLGASSPQPATIFGDVVVLGAEFVTVMKQAVLNFTVQAYNWSTDTWRSITPPPWSGPFGNSVVAIVGGELFIGGGGGQGTNQQLAAYSYNTGTDQWRRLPDAPVSFSGDEIYPDASPGQFAVGFAADGSVVMFDASSARWTVGAPDPVPSRRETPVIWTGAELVVWSGGQLREVQPNAFDVIPASGGVAYAPSVTTPSDVRVCTAARHPWQIGPRFAGETGDGLPPSGSASRAAADALLTADAQRLKEQYHAISAVVREDGGRAWRRAADGSIEIVDEEIATVVLSLASPDDCPDAPTSYNGIPLTFEVKN